MVSPGQWGSSQTGEIWGELTKSQLAVLKVILESDCNYIVENCW